MATKERKSPTGLQEVINSSKLRGVAFSMQPVNEKGKACEQPPAPLRVTRHTAKGPTVVGVPARPAPERLKMDSSIDAVIRSRC
jgi:hypothetical protein